MTQRTHTIPYTTSTGLSFTIRVYFAGMPPERYYYAYIMSADPGVPYEHQIWKRWSKPEHAYIDAERFLEMEFGE